MQQFFPLIWIALYNATIFEAKAIKVNTFHISRDKEIETRKTTGFKSLLVTLCENCPNTVQKLLRIWTPFMERYFSRILHWGLRWSYGDLLKLHDHIKIMVSWVMNSYLRVVTLAQIRWLQSIHTWRYEKFSNSDEDIMIKNIQPPEEE